jgi:hypothetical protein
MPMVRQPFETLEGQGAPTVRQLSVFLENRVGQLLRLTQLIEAKNIRILGLSVIDSADFAVVRLLLNSPDDAATALREGGFAVSVAEVLVIKLPHDGRGLLTVLSALLSAEINIAYTYPLLPARFGAAIAVALDSLEIACDILHRRKFVMLSEDDLQREA